MLVLARYRRGGQKRHPPGQEYWEHMVRQWSPPHRLPDEGEQTGGSYRLSAHYFAKISTAQRALGSRHSFGL
jgi:hypothetical protein